MLKAIEQGTSVLYSIGNRVVLSVMKKSQLAKFAFSFPHVSQDNLT